MNKNKIIMNLLNSLKKNVYYQLAYATKNIKIFDRI